MAEKKETKKEKKSPYRVWIKPSIMERVEAAKEADNCSSNSEFVEKALQFYLGYLTSKENRFFLPNAITSTMKSIVNESANQQRTLMFKMAVEMAIMMNILALNSNLESDAIDRLRGYCIQEVKKSNGKIGRAHV